MFERIITRNSVVFDIGAHVGFYTLLSSALVGRKGKVFAFEPLQRNLGYLREHLNLNQVKNVTVIEAAISDKSGTAFFEPGKSSATGSLSTKGQDKVTVFSLDEIIQEGKVPEPDCLKIDVEGGEMDVLIGAQSLLRTRHPTIFLATHGHNVHKECCEFLSSLGYNLSPIEGDSIETTDEVLAIHQKSDQSR
jgi:FkbM family methyltransferase